MNTTQPITFRFETRRDELQETIEFHNFRTVPSATEHKTTVRIPRIAPAAK